MADDDEDADIKQELAGKENTDEFTTAKKFLSARTKKLVCQSCGMKLYRQCNVCRACGERDEEGIGVTIDEHTRK